MEQLRTAGACIVGVGWLQADLAIIGSDWQVVARICLTLDRPAAPGREYHEATDKLETFKVGAWVVMNGKM